MLCLYVYILCPAALSIGAEAATIPTNRRAEYALLFPKHFLISENPFYQCHQW